MEVANGETGEAKTCSGRVTAESSGGTKRRTRGVGGWFFFLLFYFSLLLRPQRPSRIEIENIATRTSPGKLAAAVSLEAVDGELVLAAYLLVHEELLELNAVVPRQLDDLRAMLLVLRQRAVALEVLFERLRREFGRRRCGGVMGGRGRVSGVGLLMRVGFVRLGLM